MDGFSLLEYIRNAKLDIPVIILTSLTDIKDLSKGYELGCNDYIRKPFDMVELKFRIEQLIKKSFSTNDEIVTLPDLFKFDVNKSILYKDENQIDLTYKEAELVSLLIQNRSFFVSIETLHERIWENKEILYADIRMCIKRIREKTGKDFIKTKRFVGYKIDK
jgi:DNA-binding response OmpR family regulator